MLYKPTKFHKKKKPLFLTYARKIIYDVKMQYNYHFQNSVQQLGDNIMKSIKISVYDVLKLKFISLEHPILNGNLYFFLFNFNFSILFLKINVTNSCHSLSNIQITKNNLYVFTYNSETIFIIYCNITLFTFNNKLI